MDGAIGHGEGVEIHREVAEEDTSEEEGEEGNGGGEEEGL